MVDLRSSYIPDDLPHRTIDVLYDEDEDEVRIVQANGVIILTQRSQVGSLIASLERLKEGLRA